LEWSPTPGAGFLAFYQLNSVRFAASSERIVWASPHDITVGKLLAAAVRMTDSEGLRALASLMKQGAERRGDISEWRGSEEPRMIGRYAGNGVGVGQF
jgi:hypothetical protein